MTDSVRVLVFDGPEYLYRQISDDVAERIERGALRSGDRLPREDQMAEQYKVAKATVRRALRELRDRGLVVTLPAKGTFVTPARRRQ